MARKKKRPVILWVWDVAKRLWLSPQYLSELINDNKIPYQKISSWVAFLEYEIDEYIEDRKQKAKKDPRIKLK